MQKMEGLFSKTEEFITIVLKYFYSKSNDMISQYLQFICVLIPSQHKCETMAFRNINNQVGKLSNHFLCTYNDKSFDGILDI